MKSILFLLLCSFVVPAFADDLKKEDPENPVCIIQTSKGDITVELFSKEAPLTVSNFVFLAKGEKEFQDPNSGEMVKKPYYDGLIFHRVIKDFMLQTGCPLGTGTGGPGYVLPDEINADDLGLNLVKALDDQGRPNNYLMIRSQDEFNAVIIRPIIAKLKIGSKEEYEKRQKEIEEELGKLTLKDCFEGMGYIYNDKLHSHDITRGVLAMANRGPNTNGGQFFINLVDTPWLRGKHTVFGKVLKGMDVVDAIGSVKVDERSKPLDDIKIISIRFVGDKEGK